MNRSEMLAYLKKLHEKCFNIAEKKNTDYAAQSDPFAGFKIVESYGLTSAETAIFIRMTDKMGRISNLITSRKTQILDESLEDSLVDLANYSLLLAAYLKSKENGEKKSKKPRK